MRFVAYPCGSGRPAPSVFLGVNLDESRPTLFPLFLKLAGRSVLLVGGGEVATGKARALAGAGADVTIVSPQLTPGLAALAAARAWRVEPRTFEDADLDGAWLAVAAAPPPVNHEVARAGERRRVFVLAVDHPAAASAYAGGVVRRGGVTLAVSTGGEAPALAGLLREGLDALLPPDLGAWVNEASRARPAWKAAGIPLAARRPLLLAALNALYAKEEEDEDDDAAAADVEAGASHG